MKICFLFIFLTANLTRSEKLESKLVWFFDKMSHDLVFRDYVLGLKLDELSQSLDFLLTPLSQWLVLLDPGNWPQPKKFGVALNSDIYNCSNNKRFFSHKAAILHMY